MPNLRLTRRTIDDIPFSASGQILYRDTLLSGFGLRVGSRSKVYFAEGQVNREPSPLKKIGSFEQWGLIREALVWLDQPDPALTRERVMADDPHKAVLVDFLTLWRNVFQDQKLSLSEVAHMAREEGREDAQAIINELIANTNGRVFNTRALPSGSRTTPIICRIHISSLYVRYGRSQLL